MAVENADLPTASTPPRVRAKRAGWSESLTGAQLLDHEPLSEKGYLTDDLEGSLVTVRAASGVVVTLVAGQEADPSTVVRVSDVGNAEVPPFTDDDDSDPDLDLDDDDVFDDWTDPDQEI